MNNKVLFIVFILLLAIYGLSKVFSNKSQSSFNADLIEVDTAAVTAITLYPLAENGTAIQLTREGNQWLVSKENLTTKAVSNVVNGLLSSLNKIKAIRIAAKKEDKWAQYEVTEDKGTRVQVFAGDELLEDMIVGKFNFNQQTRSATSFIRLNGENEVYAVDGFLGMSFNRDMNAFRNKQLLKINPSEKITTINLQGTSPVNLQLGADGWMANNAPADSSAVANYINALKNLSGAAFADNFDETRASENLIQTITLRGDNMPVPYEISIYRDTTAAMPFVIHSSQYPTAYFASDSTGVFEKLQFKN